MKNPSLQSTIEVQVRFSELDPLQIVWHGNYIRYFEDGREDFGKKYAISYIDMKNAGVATPIVKVNCDYKHYLKYPETILIETTYQPTAAAKIVLSYKIYRKETRELIAEGQTTQVFTDFEGNLLLCSPEFYDNWKIKWGIE
jgi:acyl-CoA thioester hydrolase